MVEDTRKTLCPGAFKPLNTPEQLAVVENRGLPSALKGKQRQGVAAILDSWRIDDEWWRNEPLSRIYFEIILDSGQRLVIFKDLRLERWYRQIY